jgi:hypothetical protein
MNFIQRERVGVEGEQHSAALRAEQVCPAVMSGAQQRLRFGDLPTAYWVSRQGTDGPLCHLHLCSCLAVPGMTWLKTSAQHGVVM